MGTNAVERKLWLKIFFKCICKSSTFATRAHTHKESSEETRPTGREAGMKDAAVVRAQGTADVVQRAWAPGKSGCGPAVGGWQRRGTSPNWG